MFQGKNSFNCYYTAGFPLFLKRGSKVKISIAPGISAVCFPCSAIIYIYAFTIIFCVLGLWGILWESALNYWATHKERSAREVSLIWTHCKIKGIFFFLLFRKKELRYTRKDLQLFLAIWRICRSLFFTSSSSFTSFKYLSKLHCNPFFNDKTKTKKKK